MTTKVAASNERVQQTRQELFNLTFDLFLGISCGSSLGTGMSLNGLNCFWYSVTFGITFFLGGDNCGLLL